MMNTKLPLLALLLATFTLQPLTRIQASPSYALLFNGTNNYVRADIPKQPYGYTISAWVYLRQGYTDGSRGAILSGTNCGSTIELLVHSVTANQNDPQYLELGWCDYYNGNYSTNAVPLNQWTHVAVTVSYYYKMVNYYINGQPAGTFNYTSHDTYLNTPILLGANNGIRYFNGMLDEVQIWSTELSRAQIQTNMYCAPDTNNASLVAYWPFNEGLSGQITTADASGHGCTGTLVNHPQVVASSVGTQPMVLLNGNNPLTNDFYTTFTDPGATIWEAPTALGGGTFFGVALKADGSVAAWGLGSDGQTAVPSSATNGIAIAVGSSFSLTLRADGSVVAWGADFYDQTIVPSSVTNAVAIAAGGYHSLALNGAGSLTAWGSDNFGEGEVPASATNIIAMAAGLWHNLALRANGSVVGWGYNYSLDGSTYYGQAVVPAAANNVVALAAGGYFSMALRADGSVIAWGCNDQGQTNVSSLATNVVAIAAGYKHCLALRKDGSVVAWGNNAQGQIDVPLAATANVVAIAAGGQHSSALKSDGTVVVWGDNTGGVTTVPSSVGLPAAPVAARTGAVDVVTPGIYTLTYYPTNPFGIVWASTNRSVVVVATKSPTLSSPGIYTIGSAATSFNFSVNAVSGQSVVVEACTNLASPTWVPLQTNAVSGSALLYSDTNWMSHPSYFYRLRLCLP